MRFPIEGIYCVGEFLANDIPLGLTSQESIYLWFGLRWMTYPSAGVTIWNRMSQIQPIQKEKGQWQYRRIRVSVIRRMIFRAPQALQQTLKSTGSWRYTVSKAAGLALFQY
jgi:hypothetical protein